MNLARSLERRAHMMDELQRVDIEYDFVDAVDGRDVDLSDIRLVDPTVSNRSPYWAGVVGCYLSQLEVHNQVLRSGADRALVLEDDVLLPTDMRTSIEAASCQMAGAEAILLHHHRFDRSRGGGPYRFFRRNAVPLPGSRTLTYPADVRDVGATGANLVTREASQRMASAASAPDRCGATASRTVPRPTGRVTSSSRPSAWSSPAARMGW